MSQQSWQPANLSPNAEDNKALQRHIFVFFVISRTMTLQGHRKIPISADRFTLCYLMPTHAHITERPRKHESVLLWRRTRFVRGRLITKILHLSERVTHLHIAVPTKTRFYPSRIHVLKIDSEDGFRTGCRNISHKQQSFSGL